MFARPEWNTRFRLLILGGPVYLLILLGGGFTMITRSPAMTGVNVPVRQPLPFSHEHHAGELKIDCRYCHASVEESAFAGMPSTDVCMTCHTHLWTALAAVQTLHSSQRTGIPVEWRRVHDLPDFAYFHHGIHSDKGIGCVTCHGRVDQMPEVWKVRELNMKWCLDCHREPLRHVQPRSTITDMDWQPPETATEIAALAASLGISTAPITYGQVQEALAVQYRIQRRTSCSNCHQ